MLYKQVAMGEETEQTIVMYGRPRCSDCEMAKSVFAQTGVVYQYVDVRENERARGVVATQAREKGRDPAVPTIIFPPQAISPDGLILIEPNEAELREAVNQLQSPYRQIQPSV